MEKAIEFRLRLKELMDEFDASFEESNSYPHEFQITLNSGDIIAINYDTLDI